MTSNQTLFARARQWITRQQRARAVERSQEKREREKQNVELELFLDDAVANGLDPSSPRDLAIIFRAWAMKNNEDDGDTMERDHADLTY